MKILGISTSSKITSVAIIDDDNIIAEFSSSKIKSEDLVILIERVLNETGLNIKDIEAVSVCKGPGSYSGLRGGLAAAKSFSQVLNIPIVSVPTLHAIAYNLRYIKGAIFVILDGTRSEVNVALFSCNTGIIKRLTKDLVISINRTQEIIEQIKGEMYIINNVKEIDCKKLLCLDPYYSIPHAVNVAKIGLEKIRTGDIDDFMELVPEYLHAPNVSIK